MLKSMFNRFRSHSNRHIVTLSVLVAGAIVGGFLAVAGNWIGFPVSAPLTGTSYASEATDTSEDELITAVLGRWKFVSEPATEFHYGAELNLLGTDKCDLTVTRNPPMRGKNGAKIAPLNLTFMVYDLEKKTYRFQVEYIHDQPSAGGSGPRKGLMRINTDGRLELLVNNRATLDFPVDFTDPSRKERFFHTLERIVPDKP